MPLGPLAAAGFGKPDHGTLPGLGDDDHPQYAEIANTETISSEWTYNADIQMGSGYDIYPRANELGLMLRADGARAWDEHFDVSSLPGGWAWAAYAGYATPGTIAYDTDSTISAAATGNNKCFLYESIDTDMGFWYATVASNARAAGNYWGVRIDDGTDNNFCEIRVHVASYPPTTWRFDFAEQQGGAGINVTNCNTVYAPYPYGVGLQITGTKWTDWACWGHVIGLVGVLSQSIFWEGSKTSMTWTPSRTGWVFYNVDGTAWYTYWLDAFTEEVP